MYEDHAHFPAVDPVRAGLKGVCPRCGEGRLFDGFLSLKPECQACGLDYGFADAGDGPAVFVIMIIGFLVVGMALWAELTFQPPLWVHLLLWAPVTLVLCLALLRALKGVLITLQYKHNAREGAIDDGKR
ncbi:DUF983 domain-containing protein [Georhizobium profundi]|jgi:uncharacterized protein (DUF983 family)|uniref:DUF983 domain-containing protein n=1 Tax=Georhizobium profundi TaxID=2341112 RepID=A0A3Q8XQC1_9HYPH|nr:DUF983 domain-containing protein [Georhizobium profundi]AZN72799.1 DUF983 domain-containing protein [Georhizobium profundi]